MKFRGLCGENLETVPSNFGGNETLAIHRVVHALDLVRKQGQFSNVNMNLHVGNNGYGDKKQIQPPVCFASSVFALELSILTGETSSSFRI